MLSVTYEHLRRDSLAFQAHWSLTSWFSWVLLVLFVIATLPGTLSSLQPEMAPGMKVAVTVVMELVLVTGAVVLSAVLIGVMFLLHRNPGVYTTHTITADSFGIRETTAVNDSSHAWAGVRRIAHTRNHLFLYVGPWTAHAIPRRAFRSGDDFDCFYQGLLGLKAASAGA